MKPALARSGIGILGAAVVLAAILLRAAGTPAREGPTRTPVPSASPGPGRPAPEAVPPDASGPLPTLEAAVRIEPSREEPPPADADSFEIRLDDARTADVSGLDPTGSQRTTIETLLRREALLMEELRRDLERLGPDAWADVSRRARELHAGTRAAVRQSLLPEQAERFDRWVREGRWPGYALPVPSPR